MTTTRLDYVKHTNMDDFADFNNDRCIAVIVPLNREAWAVRKTMWAGDKGALMIGIRDDLRHRGIIGPEQSILFCSPAGYFEV